MNPEIKLETKLVGEIKGDFYVPSYQRGYGTVSCKPHAPYSGTGQQQLHVSRELLH